MEEVNHRRLEKFTVYMGIGKILEPPNQITGGLLHTMYAVTTKKGKYAIKELNQAIMKREEALANMINSENIGRHLAKKIPAVVAIRRNECSVTQIDGYYYMLFPWQEGKSIFNEQITTTHCKKVGDLLGKIHKEHTTIKDASQDENQYETYNWKNWYDRGRQIGIIWHKEVEDALEKIYTWTERAEGAVDKLQAVQVISHRDLDPKNVLWDNNMPYVIDWEAAGRINPYQELIEVINAWSCNSKGEINKLKVEAILKGYQKHCKLSGVKWEIVMDSLFAGMLGWLAYNMKRSLGIESMSQEDQKVGTQQVTATLADLRRYEERLRTLKSWLII